MFHIDTKFVADWVLSTCLWHLTNPATGSEDVDGKVVRYVQKFEAEITASEDGLQVTTEEDELTIPRPDEVTAEFSMLTVTDDGKA